MPYDNRIRIRPNIWEMMIAANPTLEDKEVLIAFVNTLCYLWATGEVAIGHANPAPQKNVVTVQKHDTVDDFDALLEDW